MPGEDSTSQAGSTIIAAISWDCSYWGAAAATRCADQYLGIDRYHRLIDSPSALWFTPICAAHPIESDTCDGQFCKGENTMTFYQGEYTGTALITGASSGIGAIYAD